MCLFSFQSALKIKIDIKKYLKPYVPAPLNQCPYDPIPAFRLVSNRNKQYQTNLKIGRRCRIFLGFLNTYSLRNG